MIRKFVPFVGLILCLFVYGCDDSANLNTLLTVAPDLIAPDTEGVVTDLTPEVWEKIRFVREFGVKISESLIEQYPERDDLKASYEKKLEKAARLKEMQEEFYNRHIDADGVSIIGNEVTPDKYFIMARNILLIMMSKTPRLREPLRDNFYKIIVGGARHSPVLGPRLDGIYLYYLPELLIAGGDWFKATCSGGWQGWDHLFEQHTSSGLLRVKGWCVSPVFHSSHYPYRTFIHELMHILEYVMFDIDPTFKERLEEAHRNAMDKGLWLEHIWRNDIKRGYYEWWPEVLEIWFFNTGVGTKPWTVSEFIFESYQDFEEYDPIVTKLIRQWFPEISFATEANYVP